MAFTKRFRLLFISLLAASVLVYYIFRSKTENEASKILETSSPLKENVKQDSKESIPASRPGLQTAGMPWWLSEKLIKLYDGVETFVMFIGYPRSSHSLVGALLDAHPEIIITHEFDIMSRWSKYQSSKMKQKNLQKYVLFYNLHQYSMRQAKFGIRSNNSNTTTKYTYNVPGLLQGKYQKRIKVIGDKKGGVTSKQLTELSKMKILEEIHQVVQVPMKFIHVIRNPFDNISTMMLRATLSRGKVREEGVKINNTGLRLNNIINQYFQLVAANQRVRERYGNAVLDIPGHETVLRPKETLLRLCDHLQVTCSEEYIEKCSEVLYGTPSVTRDKVVWTEEQKARVTQMMKKYPFLKQYSFDEYPK
ncbi:uncharacterized protein LOC144654642 [Oculina patagonica]